jgi:RHS repeat-associated protein
MMSNRKRAIAAPANLALAFIGVALQFAAGVAGAASISVPATSSTGTFSVSWTAGYELRLADAHWRVAAAPASTHRFSELPSGTYKFMLASCGWTYSWPIGYLYSCGTLPSTVKTVTVTRDQAPAIDAWTREAGTTAYRASVSRRGSARISVPLRVPDAVNGLALELSLQYDSARRSDRALTVVDDELGYGWALTGVPYIHRCRAGLADDPYFGGVPDLTPADRVCLGGEPLTLVAGTHWQADAEYRKAVSDGSRIFLRQTTGIGQWFEVHHADGSVARFGDTTGSQVVGSGRTNFFPGDIHVNASYFWGLRHWVSALGGVLTVDYQRFDGYGALQPKTIAYSGAEIEFGYGPRGDLAPVSLGFGTTVKRLGLLNRVSVRMNGRSVREYRLESTADSGGRLLLERIQECGYDTTGTVASCLQPLTMTWTGVSGGTANFPVAVGEILDGLGAGTQFSYRALTVGQNPLTYSEAPFGEPMAVADTAAQDLAAVSELRVADGLGGGGFRRWTYAYKGAPLRSTRNRGYIGFAEVRERDEQSGQYTYTQTRLDWPFQGAVSQARTFDGAFGAQTRELARFEHGYAQKVHANGARYLYLARATHWVFEGGAMVGGEVQTTVPCFRTLSGDTCPGSGSEHEYVTQQRVVTTTGNGLSNPGFTPAFWGDVPARAISSTHLRRTVTALANLANTQSPAWIRDAVTRYSLTHAVPGQTAKTVTQVFSYKPNTRVVASTTRLPGDSALWSTFTRTFDGANQNMVSSQTLQGANVAARTTTFMTPYQDGRYQARETNALDQTVTRVTDERFGQPETVTDANGRSTRYEYDALGRLVRQTGLDGTEVEIAYERCDLVGCPDVDGAALAVRVSLTTRNGALPTAPERALYLDLLGREVLTEVAALRVADGMRRQHRVYDHRNRVKYVSRPYFSLQAAPVCSGAGSDCTGYVYDERDRVIREDRPDGGVTTTAIAGSAGSVTMTVSETVRTPGVTDASRVSRSVFNVLGQLTQTTDGQGTGAALTTAYGYDAHGNLATVSVGGVNVASLEYDLAGNRTRIVEPNSGTLTLVYNALGELTRMTDAKGQVTTYDHDSLGRLVRRVDAGGVTHAWSWDPANAVGALGSRTRPGFAETYSYHPEDGRLAQIQSQVNVSGVWASTLSRSFGYDAARRLASQTYPNGQVVTYAYSPQGYLAQVKQGQTVLHDWRATDAFGSPTEEQFHGNAFRSLKQYDAGMGRVTSIQTGTLAMPKSIQDLETVWRSNSTLYRRIDRRNTSTTADDYIDTLLYDSQDRLVRQTTTAGASRTLDFSYDLAGNLTSKTSSVPADLSVAGYAYALADQPHRLTSVSIGGVGNLLTYDANGNITRYSPSVGVPTFLSFDGQNNVTQITVGASADAAAPQARDRFWYDPDNRRFLSRETWDDGGTQQARRVLYLGGDYEDVRPPAGSAYDIIQRIQVTDVVRLVRRRPVGGGQFEVYYEYAHRDHLGSVDVITSAAGVVESRSSFDPFGTRREVNRAGDLSASGLGELRASQDLRGSRGFTGHEHLSLTGFIHMNGRVYDPRIGRFVSPDPVVQALWSSQSYNRYAYVRNNPLSATDPSGFACVSGWQEPHLGVTCGAGSHLERLNTNGGSILSAGPGGIGETGGINVPDLAGLVAQLNDQLAPKQDAAEDPGMPLEVVIVVGDDRDSTPRRLRDKVMDRYARELANLSEAGVQALFGGACAGTVLGACATASLQTADGTVQVTIVIGVIPGAGVAAGSEVGIATIGPRDSSGVGTAVVVAGGLARVGGSVSIFAGSDGVGITGAAGYGFGLGGGVGFYYTTTLGTLSR